MKNGSRAIRVLVDNKELDQRYLILGSASRDLIAQSSETLAGRITYLELTPFMFDDLLVNPKLGASWEGFALEQIIFHLDAQQDECYFWGTHQQAELDLLIIKNGKRFGFEIKYAGAPKLTKSMQIVQEDLALDALTVVYPGDIEYPLTKEIHVKPLKSF